MFARTLVLGWGIALAAPAAWAKEGACFGTRLSHSGSSRVLPRAAALAGTRISVRGPLAVVRLSDGCRGDDSRLCCPLPAYGQLVRVEGTLVRSGARHYRLQSPQICQEPVAP